MKKYLVTGLVLAVFSLACALILSLVNYFTAPVIAKANQDKIDNSISLILGKEVTTTEIETSFDVQANYINLKGDDSKWKSTSVKIVSTYKVEDSGNTYVFYLIDTKGFASTISIMIGVDKDSKIVGSNVISQAETKGDVSKHDFALVGKSSTDSIDMLGGSTFSSKAVKRAFTVAISASASDLGGNK